MVSIWSADASRYHAVELDASSRGSAIGVNARRYSGTRFADYGRSKIRRDQLERGQLQRYWDRDIAPLYVESGHASGPFCLAMFAMPVAKLIEGRYHG
jgi:hypothetical protein